MSVADGYEHVFGGRMSVQKQKSIELNVTFDQSPDETLIIIWKPRKPRSIDEIIALMHNKFVNSHPFHTLQLAVSTSITRAHHLKNHNNPSSLKTLVHPKTYGGYSIDLKFGTPPQTFPFVLDTGSSLVWLPCYSHYLCSKCNSFSNNNTPKFIPKDSFSSKFVGCRNPKCAWVFGSDVTSHCCKLAKAAFSNNNNCSQTCPAYTVQYGLGSTAGFLLSENLNFPAKNVSDFLVGCSVVSVYQPGGIAGFGRGEESLPAQMNLTRFSYCLLSHQFDESPENSDLVMEATNSGEGKKTNGVSYTAFLKNPSTKKPAFGAYYYITLRKIVVGEKRVRVPRRMLEPDVNGDGGFIVDSGSTLTFMERPIFDLVAEEFVKQVNYTRARELEKQFGLSPCFVLAGGAETASFPEMRFEFRGGAKMRLPVANYFSLVGKGDVACLTIVSDDVAGQGGAVGPAVILGNYQQQNFYVECDLENERFGFRSQSCQKRITHPFPNLNTSFKKTQNPNTPATTTPPSHDNSSPSHDDIWFTHGGSFSCATSFSLHPLHNAATPCSPSFLCTLPWMETFMTKGYSTIKVSYIGENMVLLAWEEEDNLSDIFEGEEE
ncbi:hypothetical protein JHK84_027487 [Glycine max]|nr:hypothetical protein JHK84_027487 [Glycine max]